MNKPVQAYLYLYIHFNPLQEQDASMHPHFVVFFSLTHMGCSFSSSSLPCLSYFSHLSPSSSFFFLSFFAFFQILVPTFTLLSYERCPDLGLDPVIKEMNQKQRIPTLNQKIERCPSFKAFIAIILVTVTYKLLTCECKIPIKECHLYHTTPKWILPSKWGIGLQHPELCTMAIF